MERGPETIPHVNVCCSMHNTAHLGTGVHRSPWHPTQVPIVTSETHPSSSCNVASTCWCSGGRN